jgi:hypothetical protein
VSVVQAGVMDLESAAVKQMYGRRIAPGHKKQ